jgi:chemotaxis protein CheX
MRVEYINPFVEASFYVLREVLGTELRRGRLCLKAGFGARLGVTSFVGLTGDVAGRVLIDMSPETALAIASAMNGESLPAFNELAKATIGELTNMITAQAVTRLHASGFEFDLTPPRLFCGESREDGVAGAGTETLIIPIEMPLGKIEIKIAVREKE